MADLGFTFNVHGISFGQGLDRLEAAYDAGREVLEKHLKEAMAIFDQHLADPSVGSCFTEDEDPAHDRRAHLEYEVEIVKEALKEMRASFLVSLNHYWERHSKRWVGAKEYDSKKAYEYIESCGIVPSRTDIDILRDVANLIKHNNYNYFMRICEKDPGLLSVSIADAEMVPPEDYYHALRLNEEDVKRFFSALRLSGPTWQSVPGCREPDHG